MITEHKIALKLWEELYGKSVEAVDFTGRKMNKSAYEQKNSKLGWTVSCLLPRSVGGKTTLDNLTCMHIKTAEEKGEEFPCFIAADKKYGIACDEQTGRYIIEEVNDSESIAENEARTRAAIELWDGVFGEAETAVDFAGREIHKNEYASDGAYSWRLAPYVESKPMEQKNVYIANIVTAEEAIGRTAFKANGKSFTLNKENGGYYFKELAPKPPKKEYDVKNPYDVAKKINEICTFNSNGDSVMLDFITIRAVTYGGASASDAQNVTDTVNAILSDCGCAPFGCEVSETADELGARYMFITFRFQAAQPSDFEQIFSAAELLNTYATLIMSMLKLSEFKIYNYAEFVNRAHIRFSVGFLSGYYPQFAAFMDSIYKSADGFYFGEPSSTLYVANMIIVNVPALLALHPQETEMFYTPVYLAEHNYPNFSIMGAIQGVLAGVPEQTEIPENVVVPEKTIKTENDNASIEPVKEETDDVTENGACSVWIDSEADSEEDATSGESCENIEAEAVIEKTETDDSCAVEENTEKINSASETVESFERKTPEGEQLTMAFPTINDGDDGILTLELD